MAMVTWIRNVKVYQPEYAGRKDILVLGDKIAAVAENLRVDFGGSVDVQQMDGDGLTAVPGLIDSHEHILGGGGEGGFHTRDAGGFSHRSDSERNYHGGGMYRNRWRGQGSDGLIG